MKKQIRKIILLMIVFLINIVGVDRVSAATGGVSVKTSSYNAIVGNTITVTATVYSSSALGSWDATLSYDSSKLTLTSSTSQRMVGYGDGIKTSSSYTFTFRAKSSGAAAIYISSANILDWTTEQSISLTRGSTSIKIITQAELEASYSSNNYLSSLTVDNQVLSPEFNRDTLEYSLELVPDTSSMIVNAVVADSTATVNGTGEISLSDGENIVEVKVTSQNGNLRTYVIKATVKEYDPIEVAVGDKTYTVVRKKASLTAPTNYTETTVKIKDTDVPAFISEITKYTLVGLKDTEGNIGLYVYDSENSTYELYKEVSFKSITIYPMELEKGKIPKNYERTTIAYNDQIITAYKLNSTTKYALIYGMNIETGTTNIYMYDSVENTVQIYNTEELVELNKTNDMYFKIIIGVSTLALILFISLIISIIKKGSKKEKVVKDKKNNKEEVISEVIDDKTKELKLKNLLFDEDDEEETRLEKNQKLTDAKELKKQEKLNKKEEKLRAKEEAKLNKKRKKNSKKDSEVKVTKIEFDDDRSLY